MPGAGSFLAVNRVHSTLPKDGTVIGLGAPTLALDEKLGSQGVRFKTAELNWLGRVDSLINIVMMWKTSPVKTIADAQKIESTLSGTGAGSTVSIYPTVLNNVIGTKFKLVMGYRGSNEAMLAMERGEVEGHSTAWSAVKVAKPDWVRDKTVSIIVQFALKRHPELPDVPTAVELARNDDERAGARRHHERERGRHRLLHRPRGSARPPGRAAPRLRRDHEGPRIPGRGATHTARRHPDDRRRAAEAGGAGQQPVARAPGEGPRRLRHEQDELRCVCATDGADSTSDASRLCLGIAVIPANIQDRDCAANLIRKTRRLFPWIAKIFADGGYAGEKLKAALEGQPVELEIVKRTDNEGGFKVVRRRWVIERTLSWLRRNRRLMAHYEAFAFIAEGFAKLAMIGVMLKRLTEPKPTCAT